MSATNCATKWGRFQAETVCSEAYASNGLVFAKPVSGETLTTGSNPVLSARLRMDFVSLAPTKTYVSHLCLSHRNEFIATRISIPGHELRGPKVLMGLGPSLDLGQEDGNEVRATGWKE